MEENLNYNRNTENNIEPTAGKPVKKRKSAFVLSVVFTSLCVVAAVLSLLLTGAMLKETGNEDQQLGFAVLVIVLLIPDIVLTVLTEVFGAVSITACARLIKTDKNKKVYAIIMLVVTAVIMLAVAAVFAALFIKGNFEFE